MKKIFEKLHGNPLFYGIDTDDFERLYGCLSARKGVYKKGEIVMIAGDSVENVGVVLSGAVQIQKEDFDGNTMILAELSSPEMFGEVFACAGVDRSPVTVFAAADCEILFINYKKIISSCATVCIFHSRLIENMLTIIARKNLMLNQKIELLSKRTTREKLWCFFDMYSGGKSKFVVPFNREEMARYLCVDRSAMSNELCKMRDEGEILFCKNEFTLL